MKKVVILLAVLAVLALAAPLWAPGYHKDPPVSPEIVPEGRDEPEAALPAEVEYEVWINGEVFSEEIPQKVQEIIRELKKERGYFAFDPQVFSTGEDLFILISSGEKRSGGYSLELNNIAAQNDTLEIAAAEKKPLQGTGVIQVLTYPVLLLKVKNGYDHLNVANTAGEAFQQIAPLAH